MVTEYSPENAPGFAKHSSTFKNDDRCYAVKFFVADDYDDAFNATYDSRLVDDTIIDYDVNYSTEGGKWVGVTVRDCE